MRPSADCLDRYTSHANGCGKLEPRSGVICPYRVDGILAERMPTQYDIEEDRVTRGEDYCNTVSE